ncbi:hypothetical protein SERLA73DRAFT_68487 [Serpula lacrymans var. lacrymans S7.3]|uniref:Uncharacterized protein n=2 Tax=Serpula lacrymans var. lacrymans TaxID=341189 RepID=F8PGB6_SERL3|nr:uncharacterized protein SERLADRAFT_432243 [Serpula lacrymans var. lacrymans S7.9]EGO04823.1 hypothetical protein SERLA73DRAFT_68487 [Serpula lacrymans var. lacrymans S7.3]EGO30652.1 hypothetical protein SERLADRAFT_432243 [Serpula lacrymans var. lacrymans S7.9]
MPHSKQLDMADKARRDHPLLCTQIRQTPTSTGNVPFGATPKCLSFPAVPCASDVTPTAPVTAPPSAHGTGSTTPLQNASTRLYGLEMDTRYAPHSNEARAAPLQDMTTNICAQDVVPPHTELKHALKLRRQTP